MTDLARIAADVRAVVAAAAGLAGRDDEAWLEALAASTGLSRQGVGLALREALEREASDDDVRLLAARVRPAVGVTVVLAANVFVAAVRAVALALAASARVHVRPSRRDPVFARALVEALGDPRVTLVEEATFRPGVVHAYGRDTTMRALADATGMPVWAHGAGLSLALVGAAEDPLLAARALAEDVILFDQRGCLSPRVALFVGPAAGADTFAEALVAALHAGRRAVPPGALTPAERAELASARDVALMCGEVRGEAGAMVAVAPMEEHVPCMVLPPGRHVVVVPAPTRAAAASVVKGFGRAVVGVASNDAALLGELAPPWARRAALGRLQRPRLDGPVDLRDVWLGRRGP